MPLSLWFNQSKKPFVIAGPCSAETEAQVVETALALSHTGIDLFRAGIWKPRTRPNSFEGAGVVGLKWLNKVREVSGLPVTVEVAKPSHVEECLKHNIDVLWLGARTTVNPFIVQEIADALKGVKIPVLVKNPINPDLELWLGALERLHNAGIEKIAAVHRGFSTYQYSKYRNKPTWDIPLELKRIIPDLPVICDPSHICGNTEDIPYVSQKAMDLAFDGLMIETHINPEKALSDAKQQVTPSQLSVILNNLILRDVTTDNSTFISQLEGLRKVIDRMDRHIIETLSKRMKVVNEIAEHKKLNNITIHQQKRWNQIINNAIKTGAENNFSEDSIIDLFKIIHRESIRIQNRVLNADHNTELESFLELETKKS